MGLVLDSSVVGSWCFPDETSPVADAAFASVGADKGLVPALWWFEVRNVLLMGERYGRIDPAGTAEFLADLDDYRFAPIASPTAQRCSPSRVSTG